MTRCHQCQIEIPASARFCPGCGAEQREVAAPVASAVDPTAAVTQPFRATAPTASGNGDLTSTALGIATGSLNPGTVLAGRYRIVGLLGRGGMGAVYRAEDLTLRENVALKFLSEELVSDERSVTLLLNEARLARQITHPNVCRVHDIGQIEGRPFISMEYVDGEDLSSLLRRIGHLPREKALEIGRQLAAGLHAAHSQGVLHRDLKPANVMLDGQGRVRITDFGIAGELHKLTSRDSGTGTPAYMAPELFTDATPSKRSDVFSLGLVLYELYTGKPLYRAATMTELLRQHRRPVRPPSEIVPDMDPQVERVILQCLRQDPTKRPSSAFEVLAELPGGNALAELVATGSTPSPDQVVACGGPGDLCGSSKGMLIAVILVGLAAILWLEGRVKLTSRSPLPYSGEVLAHVAAQHAGRLGYAPDHDTSRTFGFDVNRDLLFAVGVTDDPARWEALREGRPPAIDFWYRQSPKPLIANHLSGKVTWDDPPQLEPGMVSLRLGPDGALREVEAVTSALGPNAPAQPGPFAGATPNWGPLFDAMQLQFERFEATEPTRVPPGFADARFAWRGTEDGTATTTPIPVRVEVALLDGYPISLAVIEENWAQALAYKPMRSVGSASAIANGVKLLSLIAAVGLAWSSFRRRRGDFRGAFRFAITVFFLVVAVTVLTAKHTSSLGGEGQIVLRGMARALLVAVQYWIYYIALEPHVRHIWPETIISWSRLLQGRFRDPLIGANVLAGIAIGIFAVVCVYLVALSHQWMGLTEGAPFIMGERAMEALAGSASSVGSFLEIVVYFTGFAMTFLLALVVLRLALGNRTAAAIGWTVIQTILWQQATPPTMWSWLFYGILATAGTLIMIRVGFLAVLIGAFTFGLLAAFPLHLDFSSWLARPTLLALGLVGAGVIFGLTTSRRQRLAPAA